MWSNAIWLPQAFSWDTFVEQYLYLSPLNLHVQSIFFNVAYRSAESAEFIPPASVVLKILHKQLNYIKKVDFK